MADFQNSGGFQSPDSIATSTSVTTPVAQATSGPQPLQQLQGDWNYSGTGGAFKVDTDQGQATAFGMAVTLPIESATENTGNAYLQHQDGRKIWLWLTDILADFQIGGSFAQSYRRREFYPRNFTQPTFILRGQAANQAEYARLAEFGRSSQLHSLRAGSDRQQINLVIPESKTHDPNHQYQGYNLAGYLNAIDRKSERFVYAPSYEIRFVMAAGRIGAFVIKNNMAEALAPWSDIFQDGTEFQDNPDKNVPKTTSTSDNTQGGDAERRWKAANNPVIDINPL